MWRNVNKVANCQNSCHKYYNSLKEFMWILVDIADVLEVVVWGRVPWEMTTFLLLTPRSPNTKLIREGDFDIKHAGLSMRLITYQFLSLTMKYNMKLTRLTYNCAHLRSTKVSLTIEYFENEIIFLWWRKRSQVIRKAKSQKPKAKSQKPKAKSQKQKPKSQKPKALSYGKNKENASIITNYKYKFNPKIFSHICQ